jgi:hypothetical protein
MNSNYSIAGVTAWVALSFVLTALAEPAKENSAPPAAPQDSWAKYQIILERNIFSRQRRPARRPEEEKAAVVVIPNPETHFVLTGVVQENNEFIAFIEDTQLGTVLRLRRDDRVARGVVKTLNLDGIEYQLDDRTTAVKLGYDLEGTLALVAAPAVASLPAVAAPTVTSRSATAAPQTAPPPAATGDEAEILRRLMEQRKQQIGQ